MGVDLRVIIGHNLTLKDIMEFPYLLDRNTELKEVFTKEIQSKLEFNISREQALASLDKELRWENITEKDLLNSWENNENLQLVDENGFIAHSLTTYFGILYFNRKTVEILYLPEHKYANLKYKPNRKFIFNYSKALAKFLGSKMIVYCADSGPTEIIECWATEGKTIERVLNLAIEKFGRPSDVLEEAIEKRFIIDEAANPFME